MLITTNLNYSFKQENGLPLLKITKTAIQVVLIHKCEWIIQKGHYNIHTKFLYLLWAQIHVCTQLNDRVNVVITLQTSNFASLSGQLGLLCTLFCCCFLCKGDQLGHQTWSKAKGKPLHTKLLRSSHQRMTGTHYLEFCHKRKSQLRNISSQHYIFLI